MPPPPAPNSTVQLSPSVLSISASLASACLQSIFIPFLLSARIYRLIFLQPKNQADLTGPSPFLHFATVRYSQFLYFYHIKISLKCNVRFLVFLYNSVFMKRIQTFFIPILYKSDVFHILSSAAVHFPVITPESSDALPKWGRDFPYKKPACTACPFAAVPRQEKAAPTGSFPNNHSIFSFLVTVRLQLLFFFIKESFRKL